MYFKPRQYPPTGALPYGYRIGYDSRPEIHEAEAEVVRRIFRQYECDVE